MEDSIPRESFGRRSLKLLIKVAVTVLCFWYISRKIDFVQTGEAFRKANWFYLFVALMLLAFSKLLSAYRLNIYFRNIGLVLPAWNNIKLYWLGMFYNLFLPGAISGDAYKVVLLKRKYNTPYKKASSAVLLDRFSGLLALGLILSVYGVVVLDKMLYEILLLAGSVAAVFILYTIIRLYFKDFLAAFWSTLLWGLAVQLTQVVCIYFILLSLHLPLQSAWIFIFLAAAVITVLPISLGGGLGTRELVFREGAILFSLNPDLAVVISLLFYCCTLISSLPGLYFVFHDPLRRNRQ